MSWSRFEVRPLICDPARNSLEEALNLPGFRASHAALAADNVSSLPRYGGEPWSRPAHQYLSMARPTDLSRELARHRGVPESPRKQAGHQEPGVAQTLADANEVRDWRIYADFAQSLIGIARRLYAGDPFGVDLKETYALDASTIDLCLSVFSWAPFRSKRLYCTRSWTCAATSLRSCTSATANCTTSTFSTCCCPSPGPSTSWTYIDFERLPPSRSGQLFVTRAK